MNLREYLFKERLSNKKFSEMVQCHPNYIWMIKEKRLVPSLRLAKDISEITNGEVSIEELMKSA